MELCLTQTEDKAMWRQRQKFEWCQYKPNEHQEIPADIRGWKRHGENSPLEPPAEVSPYCYLGFSLLGSRTVGEYISIVSSQHGCDNLLQQLQETNTFGMISEVCIWAAIRATTIITSIYQTPLEKAMAPHSSTPARKIPWMEEPGRLQSMGSLRVRHDWATSLSLFTFLHWRRKWQPTPVFLPGESQGRGSLVSCRLWGHTESDTTEVT